MTRFTRIIAAAASAAALVGAVALAPTATAADGTPLTYAQLKADPTTVAANASVKKLMAGPFTLTGSQYDTGGDVVVAETMVHKGRMYRIAATRPGLGTRIVISDGSRSCARNASSKASAAASRDLSAKWTCKKGVDTLVSGELLAITPLGMAQVLDEQTQGFIRFVPTTTSSQGSSAFAMDLTAADGTKAGVFTVAGGPGGPVKVSIAQGANNTVVGKFTVTAGSTGSIPALSRLRS